jgi:hypothetical protein
MDLEEVRALLAVFPLVGKHLHFFEGADEEGEA